MQSDVKRGTVWVLQESLVPGGNGTPMDYSPAERFGDVQFVLNIEPSRQQGGTINQHVYAQLLRMAELYREDRDYLVLTGSPLSIFMAGMVLVEVDKTPNILAWDRRTRTYRPVSIPAFPVNA